MYSGEEDSARVQEEEEKEEKEEGESFGRRILFVFNGICTCVQPCANPDIL